LPGWIARYDAAPLDGNDRPPRELEVRLAGVSLVVASELPRTAESARRLGRPAEVCSALFNEAAVARLPVPWLRLRPKNWLTLARILMTAGYRDRDGVSLALAETRAGAAADWLEAQRGGTIAVIGHGGMNWLVAKRLRARGWERTEASHANWGVTRLVKG
jgi:broad specificity phosphatase PhoE